MGDPKKLRKKYTPPKHPWEADRIKEERGIVSSFGLRNKKELWRATATVKKFRYIARSLVGIPVEQRKGEEERLLNKLMKIGLLKEGATLDDALSMKTEDLLARRLQTLTWRNGLANTLAQARQLITHGHIAVNKRRATSPGAIINVEQEKTLDWYGTPLAIVRKKEEPKKEAPAEEPKKEKKPRKKKEKKEETKEGAKEEAKEEEEAPVVIEETIEPDSEIEVLEEKAEEMLEKREGE